MIHEFVNKWVNMEQHSGAVVGTVASNDFDPLSEWSLYVLPVSVCTLG